MMLSLSRSDDLDLSHHVAVGLVTFLGLDLTGNQFEHRRDDGQVVGVEPLDAVTVRQGGLNQMTESPCYVIAVSGQVADLPFGGLDDAGDLPRHARFFCNDSFHIRFILLWI